MKHTSTIILKTILFLLLSNISLAQEKVLTPLPFNKVKLEDGSEVYQFKLIRWRSTPNGFNSVYLYIQEDGMMRKVEGITAAYQKITYQIDDIKINQNISKAAFDYEPPAHTNTVENFIINQGDE